MPEILTTTMKNDITRDFYQELLDNEFYFMISSTVIGELNRIPAVNSLHSKMEFKESILFGKQVFNSDIKFMIKYYPWQKDALYTQYDDLIDLEQSNFYSVVGPTNNDSGDYRIYKCLSNNNGALSTVPPNYNPTTENQIYRMPDGYVWKFMYYLTEQQFEAYNASGFIPLVGTFEINPDPEADANNVITGSEVSDIFVENYIDNAGYPTLESGIVVGPPGNNGEIVIQSSFLSQISNYYAGMTIYLNTPNNVAYTYVVDSSTYDETARVVRLRVVGDPKGDGVIINSTLKIVPTVEILGDGEGAVAIPRVVEGTITNIELLETGSNYNNITARIVDPIFDFEPDEDDNPVDVRATLRPVLSPLGYHGFNLIDEMHCRHVLLYAYITETDNNKIGKSNSYSAVGIVKNPEFTPDPETANTASPEVFDNRIEIITDDYGKFEVDTTVTQVDINNNITFSGRIHDIQASSNTVFICNYMGPQINSANNDISLDYDKDLINATGQRIQINIPVANNVIESRYTQRSGTVYFMEDFFPLEREDSSREEYKLVLEF
jgi:hypothetical protein